MQNIFLFHLFFNIKPNSVNQYSNIQIGKFCQKGKFFKVANIDIQNIIILTRNFPNNGFYCLHDQTTQITLYQKFILSGTVNKEQRELERIELLIPNNETICLPLVIGKNLNRKQIFMSISCIILRSRLDVNCESLVPTRAGLWLVVVLSIVKLMTGVSHQSAQNPINNYQRQLSSHLSLFVPAIISALYRVINTESLI